MHVQLGCSGNDSDVVIPSLPCSDRQPADSPHFLMAGLGTKHRVWFERFGTNPVWNVSVACEPNLIVFIMFMSIKAIGLVSVIYVD